MTRRRLVALVSASVILLITLVMVIAFLTVTQTDWGRERFVRRLVQSQLTSRMKGRGSIYIGRLDGSLLTGIVVDSFAIRDEEDSLFVSTGRISVGYDPRDLFDRRLLLSRLEIEHPYVNLRRHSDGVWNFKRIFPPGQPKPRTPERRFGDYIVLDSVDLRNGTIVLTEPWRPDTFLTATQKDSAINAALNSQTREIKETAEGLKKTSRWTELDLIASFVRIADPDTAGQFVDIAKLDVAESDPPFVFSNLRGPVSIVRDTVRLDVKHFDLPASTGRARGLVTWKGPGPTRYDVHVWGDSVTLNDINWVYPTLPREGGGSMELHIKNDERNPRVLNYAITKMDMRAASSRLLGDMTFGVGGSILVIKDVALTADPVDFDLIRALNGEDFPVDWQGTITGTIRGPGGPLNRWAVTESRFVFRDKHVPGAVSRGRARGGLDIRDPGNTVFRGFDLEFEVFDLRTPRFLFPDFPRLNGTVAGRARLDSVWTDVRFENADLTHTDGAGPQTRATGRGRLTLEEPSMRFDVDLVMQPLAFTTMARSYPALPFRGSFEGPLVVSGTLDDMQMTTTLTGPAGMMSVDGRFDMSEPGYAMIGSGRFADLDVRSVIERPSLPYTRLTGVFGGDVRGDSLANLAGTLDLSLERSLLDSVRIYPSAARLAFGGGKVIVDSLFLESSLATLLGKGAFGLARGVTDSLRYTIKVDSLGAMRSLLERQSRPIAVALDSAAARALGGAAANGNANGAATDTTTDEPDDSPMLGRFVAEGLLGGNVDTMHTRGQVTGGEFLFDGSGARVLSGEYRFEGMPANMVGVAQLRADTVLAAGIALRTLGASLSVISRNAGTVSFDMESANGVTGGSRIAYAITGDTTHARLDTLGLVLPNSKWSLRAPANFVSTRGGLFLDSLAMRSDQGGAVSLYGALPTTGPLAIEARVDSVQLADLGALVQSQRPAAGLVSMNLDITGERARPVMELTAAADGLSYGDFRLPRVRVGGSYADLRAEVRGQLLRDTSVALSAEASLPLDLRLIPVRQRMLADTLRGVVRADSVDLNVIEAITPKIRRAEGLLRTQIEVGGTWKKPTFTGNFAIVNGEAGIPELGIRLRQIEADVLLGPDSIAIRRLSASSGDRGSSASLEGVVTLQNFANPNFNLNLQTRGFQLVQRRRIADLEMTGRLRLRGSYQRAELDGSITIDKGAIYIPDQAQKNIADITDPEFRNVVDTTVVENRNIVPQPPSQLVENLEVENAQIRLGDDVWLRSEEANIKLRGSLRVDRQLARVLRADGDTIRPVIGLAGTLLADRGTYRLNLSVVQRTFQVDSGTIGFYGNPNIPPGLDIWASYTVRQVSREDVRIHAHIGGTLLEPRLDLTSSERIPLSYTEILSYLVFGQPSFLVGGTQQNTLGQVTAVLLPTIGGVLERALSEQISWLDLFQLQTAAPQQDDIFSSQGREQLLSGTGIVAGKQLGERTFLTASGTLCRPSDVGTAQNWSIFLGFTVEHRLNYGFSVVAGVEPGSVNPCTRLPGDLNPRRQVGFDLFREWRF
ncbi:MAG TPA: translocation/assembly module TamB domain-containing protein [Gemmatimonadaceae bacterium]|nr:translocation/assembly module TamB domain-containing protein [Gemmatimonadaceae bacterium]